MPLMVVVVVVVVVVGAPRPGPGPRKGRNVGWKRRHPRPHAPYMAGWIKQFVLALNKRMLRNAQKVQPGQVPAEFWTAQLPTAKKIATTDWRDAEVNSQKHIPFIIKDARVGESNAKQSKATQTNSNQIR